MNLEKENAKELVDAIEQQFLILGNGLHDGLCQTLVGSNATGKYAACDRKG